MTERALGWDTLLDTNAPAGCSLKAALLSTYKRPDQRFVVEHLLPKLLRLNREANCDGLERQYFFLELQQRLHWLHGRLVVISSSLQPTEEDADSDVYPWIWRFVRHLPVGKQIQAVQHAKLWILHWGADEGEATEYLEVVVSSANLTAAAFKQQIQAAWRVCLPLAPKSSAARLTGWGLLPDFLHELGASCKDAAAVKPFVNLLARAECPERTQFVASVPGSHSPQTLQKTPWGAAGLKAIIPSGRGTVKTSVLAPYVGSWNGGSLRQWCAYFEGKPKEIELIWIDKEHPWSRDKRWILPRKSLDSLAAENATVLHLRFDRDSGSEAITFHEEHKWQDPRWSHAKAYQFRRGKSRRLLITSANFSCAAWGALDKEGRLNIDNFELGVCIEQNDWPFNDLEAFEDLSQIETVSGSFFRPTSAILWATASWDGKAVLVECRVDKADAVISGEVQIGDRRLAISGWKSGKQTQLKTASVQWKVAKAPPQFAVLSCRDTTLEVPIFDERPRKDRMLTPAHEVDKDLAEQLQDELLFEQYGGRPTKEEPFSAESVTGKAVGPAAAADDTAAIAPIDPVDDSERLGGHGDSFGVPAFERARRYLQIVDTWASRVFELQNKAHADFERRMLREDGEQLIAAFGRQTKRDEGSGKAMTLGSRLAAEELELRLNYVRE